MTRVPKTTAALSAAILVVLGAGVAEAAWSASGSGSGSTRATSIAAPGALTTSHPTVGSGTVHLSWGASSSTFAAYNVTRAPLASGNCGTFAAVTSGSNVSGTTFDDSSATLNTEYCYRVQSVDGKWSANGTATYAGSLAPIAGTDSSSSSSSWTHNDQGSGNTFNAVAAPTSSAAWVVGANAANAAIFKWNGSAWAAQAAGFTGQSLNAVSATDASNVWTAGNGGKIGWTTNGGTSWSNTTITGTPTLSGIAAPDATHIWAVGSSKVYFSAGGVSPTFTAVPGFTTTGAVNGVYALDSSHAWAVESSVNGNVGLSIASTSNGSSWTETNLGTANNMPNLFGVFAQSASNVWAVGSAGTIYHYNGIAWATQNAPSGLTNTTLRSVWASDATHAWAVGSGGVVIQTTDGGSTWSNISTSVADSDNLFGIGGSDANHLWAVGASNSIDVFAATSAHTLTASEYGNLAQASESPSVLTYTTAGSWPKASLQTSTASCPSQAVVISFAGTLPTGTSVNSVQATIRHKSGTAPGAAGKSQLLVSGDSGAHWAGATAQSIANDTSTFNQQTFNLTGAWNSLTSPSIANLQLCFFAATDSASTGNPFTSAIDYVHVDVN